jgi:hypothetical protein
VSGWVECIEGTECWLSLGWYENSDVLNQFDGWI